MALVLVSLALVPLLPKVSASTVLFSDDFESYSVGAMNSASNPCVAPPDGTPTCQSPPHINTGYSQFPEYWIAASGDTCESHGGCVTWQNNNNMGPNSVFSVVTEQVTSGVKSLKLGASDQAVDKTDAAIHYDGTAIPTSGLLVWQANVWLSEGTKSLGNNFEFGGAFGRVLYKKYYGDSWFYAQTFFPKLVLQPLSDHFAVTTSQWHTWALAVNLFTQTYGGFYVDGVNALPSLQGIPLANTSPQVGGVNKASYYSFAMWVTPAALNGQSISSLGSTNGFYAYIDDVSLSATSSLETITSSVFSSLPSTLFSTSSNTTPEFSSRVLVITIVITIVIVLAMAAVTARRSSRRPSVR